MRTIFLSLVLLLNSFVIFSQEYSPVRWDFATEKLNDTEYDLIFIAYIQEGWVIYSSKQNRDDGPFPTVFNFEKIPAGLQKVGTIRELKTNRKRAYDRIFESEVIKFNKKAVFKQKIKLKNSYTKAKAIRGYLTFMTCSSERCLPPSDVDFSFILKPAPKKSEPLAVKAPPRQPIKNSTFPKKNQEISGQVTIEASWSQDKRHLDQFYESEFTEFGLPVKWTVEAVRISSDEYDLHFKARVKPGFYIYSQYARNTNGPMPTSFTINGEGDNFETIGKKEKGKNRIRAYDKHFKMRTTKYGDTVTFTKRIKADRRLGRLSGHLYYQTANNTETLAPLKYDFSVKVPRKITPDEKMLALMKAAAERKQQVEETETSEGEEAEIINEIIDENETEYEGQEEVEETAAQETEEGSGDGVFAHEFKKDNIDYSCVGGNSGKKNSMLWIFFAGFLGGLVALLTPCVFPMIPLTVSFFTKQSKTRAAGITNAIIYGLSIIVIYVALGLMVTGAFGPEALNLFSTNWLVNLIFFALFVVFAFSFFGYFEITLPSSWSTNSDAMADKGGLLGIFFMAFTLALVSFSCTGPIIGTLLVESVDGNGPTLIGDYVPIGPLLGMLGFSTALALPFALFAAFPGWLNSLPRSGGWMTSVKVTLGFLELALALKFLSVADMTQHWGILSIEVFLGLWIAIFLGLALYMFGFIKFPHDGPLKKISKARYAVGLASFAFAIYLTTGFTYKPLTLLSGIAPPAHYNYFQNKTQMEYPNCPNGIRCFKDYDEGLTYAKENDLPVLIDFTGFGCVNCRKVEENVWSQDKIKRILSNDYVLVSLYVDDRKKVKTYTSPYTGEKIRTVGAKWHDFQRHFFKNNSQPQYVLVDNDGTILHKPIEYQTAKDANKYEEFLKCGLEQRDKLSEK